MEQNILVTVFNVESEGYQAVAELKNHYRGYSWFVSEAALVKKEVGTYKLIDAFDSEGSATEGTLTGGLIGMCLGVLGGPVGLLLGASYGTLMGMGVDAMEMEDTASMLEQIVGKLEVGTVALVAMVSEDSPEGLDAQLSKYDAVIARFDAADVEMEVERAREMESEMQRLAKLELRKQRTEEFKAKREERRAKFKAKFAKESN